MSMEHEKSIALITQDIAYIKKDLVKMGAKLDATDTKLDAVLNHYIQREEFDAKIKDHQDQLDKRIEGAHARIKELDERIKELDDEKLEKKTFEPYKTGLNRIQWVVIMAIIGALLSLVLK